jgi:hypothetical protein
MLENALHLIGLITVSTNHKFGIDFMIYLSCSMYALVDITDLRFLTVCRAALFSFCASFTASGCW